jgi:hypothetical protein
VRHTRRPLWAVAAVGGANEVYYLAVQAVITYFSDASGGIYFSYVPVLQLALSGLALLGLPLPVLQLALSGLALLGLPWGATAAILYVTTVIGATALVGLFLRSSMRRIVTGPTAAPSASAWPSPAGRQMRRDT